MDRKMLPWIQTYKGHRFWFDHNMERNVIDLEDIAWGLANKSRYSGQTGPKFYSVAEHAILCTYLICDMGYPEYSLHALHHDDAEAYMADIPAPLKQLIPDWRGIENLVEDKVTEELNLDFPPRSVKKVKEADFLMLSLERDILFPRDRYPEWGGILPVSETEHPEWFGGLQITCLSPQEAFDVFIYTHNKFSQLLGKN